MGIVMLYQSLYLISTQFTHCNIKLPKKLNLYLSYLIVSPDMHKTYHHYRHPLTDANYGTSFSLWDRLLGNYLSFDKENLILGVNVFFDKGSQWKNKNITKATNSKLF